MKLYLIYTNDYRIGNVYVIAKSLDEAENKLLDTVKRMNPFTHVNVSRIDITASLVCDGYDGKPMITSNNNLIM